jgi:hypothetical protein
VTQASLKSHPSHDQHYHGDRCGFGGESAPGDCFQMGRGKLGDVIGLASRMLLASSLMRRGLVVPLRWRDPRNPEKLGMV